MQNKKLLKILGLIAAFLLIIFTWIVIKDAQKKKIQNTPTSTGIENPFGTSGGDVDLGSEKDNSSNNTSSENENNSTSTIPSTTVIIVEDNPVLKKLHVSSVAGFTFTTELRKLPEQSTVSSENSIVETFDFSGYKTVRFGDKTKEVVSIKTVLNRLSPSPNLTINEDYDTDMKNAVVDFQNKNGLTGDGVIGSKTYAKLNSFQGISSFSSSKKAPETETVLIARFVDSAVGTMLDVAPRKKESVVARSKGVIPGVVEAFFDDTATKVVMRYLKDKTKIETYLAELVLPKIDLTLSLEEINNLSKLGSITGTYLPDNIKTISLSRDKKNIFYMNPDKGNVVGFVYNFANKKKKEIFKSPITEWVADFTGTSKINITTSSSGQVPGYSYSLGNPSGTISKNIGGELGLTTLMSPDGKKLLFSVSTNNSVSTFVLDIATGSKTSISPSTIPEKCVWTKDSKKIYCAAPAKAINGLLPDDWYKGKISFDDVLWSIDMRDMSGNIIYDFISKNNEKIDAINLQLNSSEDYLGFINKKDGILWGFDLSR